MKPTDWWVMRRFAPSSDVRETKYVGQFFDLHQEITGLVRQIKELQKTDPAEARKLQAENADLIRFAPRTDATNDVLQSLRKQERAIFESRETPEEKRRRLAQLVARRNQIAESTVLASPRRTSPIFNPFRN
jgi:cellulose biosynthesis protein BcsQ